MKSKKNHITIFTDGSSLGNPGRGGWGAVVITKSKEQREESKENTLVAELGGKETHTTNNRMELMAAIEALLYIEKKPEKFAGDITVHLDSAYVLNGITKWVYGWEKNNWRTATKEPVLNQELWAALLEIARRLSLTRTITWEKVKGHAGFVGNERVDAIATGFAAGEMVLLFSGTMDQYEKMLGGTVHEQKTPTKKSKGKKGEAYSYVSFVGGKVHVDKTWDVCEKRVKGVKGAKYQKVLSKQEEQELIGLYSLESLL